MLIPRSGRSVMQFCRTGWFNLSGGWSYEFDFGKSGLERGLHKSAVYEQQAALSALVLEQGYCPEGGGWTHRGRRGAGARAE